MTIQEYLENNPIIPAVKNEEELERALMAVDTKIIFILYGTVLDIGEISKKVSKANKIGIVHIDLIEGLSNREIALEFLKKKTDFHGIITTRYNLIKSAKTYGLFTIFRMFIFDSLSLENAKKHLLNESDAIEILPGVIPKVIEELHRDSDKSIIVGGLVDTKEEVILALNSGATSVSTTKESIWNA